MLGYFLDCIFSILCFSADASVCFKQAVIVAPGYTSALSVTSMKGTAMNCRKVPALLDFASSLVRAVRSGLESTEKTGAVRVTLLFRKDYFAHPRLKDGVKAQRKVFSLVFALQFWFLNPTLFRYQTKTRLSRLPERFLGLSCALSVLNS